MKHLKVFFILILVLLINQTLSAQTEDKSLLSIDRIFSSGDFAREHGVDNRWIDSGKYYTSLELFNKTTGGREIVKYETETGKKEVLVPAELFIPEGKTRPFIVANHTWSPSGNMLMINNKMAVVWRQATRGDFWVLNLQTKKLQKLGGDAKQSTLMFAKFSPDEKQVSYVRENNVYVENLSDGKITQLTYDGSVTIINGTFDWVYEEELNLRDGFRWSPDSKSIAYWQLDASGVGVFNLVNNTDSIYSKIKPVQYPKVGTTNSACKVGVVSADGGETVWIKVPGDPRNNYIARMDWAASSNEIILQHLNRKQNKNEVMLGNAKTGNVKTIITETDSAFVDIYDDLYWIKGGEEFTWIGERDGWRHIYLVSRDGLKIKNITPGNYDVISIKNIDEKSGWMYFMASPDNAMQRYLYRVALDGNGKLERITPADFKGSNEYIISEGGKYAMHSYSNFDTPSISNFISLPDHKFIRTITENKKSKESVNALKRLPTEFFKIDIGNGLMAPGRMMKPYNFDATKKYPVLFEVYSAPAFQITVDQYNGAIGYLWHLMLAQQGYIVICVDSRGTPAPLGREWRKAIYKKDGVVNSGDQAAAVKALLQKYSFLDAERVGIWGWSGGGTATLNAMFRYPDLYKTGMAVAPVVHWKLYDTIYQERYLGLISENPEVYEEGSPVNFAKNLKGNLLIVHGTGDDNVHYQNTELLINELVKNNKPFTMMAYPNRTHSISEGPGTSLHMFNLLTTYLHDHLPAGAK